MRRRLRQLVCLLTVLLWSGLFGCARGEIYIEAEKPGDWDHRLLFRLTVFKGQGKDMMVLESRGENMLLDGGTKWLYKQFGKTLKELGLTRFKYIFNTHPHNDHIEAQFRLLQHDLISAELFLSPFPADYNNEFQKEMVETLAAKNIPFLQVSDGYRFELGQARLRVMQYREGMDPNGLSGVLHVTIGEATLLLTGDLSGEGQHWLAEHYERSEIQADIMKACHHGVRIMTRDFITAVEPKVVFFTNSKENTIEETNQVIKYGAYPLWNSNGRLTFETDGTDWYIYQEKGAF